MEERGLNERFQAIKKHIWKIILVTLVLTAASGWICFYLITPEYEVKADLLVNRKSTPVNAGDPRAISTSEIQTNLLLVNTYRVIITSPRIMDQVGRSLGIEGEIERLVEHDLKVENVKSSQVISISVRDKDPAKAVRIANTIATVFQAEIVNLMAIDNVHILNPAKVDNRTKPVSPQPFLIMGITFLLGLIGSVGSVMLIDYYNLTLNSDLAIEKCLGVPVLGVVPDIEKYAYTKELYHADAGPNAFAREG